MGSFRSVLRKLIGVLALAAVLTGGVAMAEEPERPSHHPQVWFSPRQIDFIPIIDGTAPAEPWNAVAGRVDVLGVTQSIRNLPDETLARLVQDLDRRHIALGLGILPINWFHEVPCGHGVEGYSDPNAARQTVAKLQKAGARIRFITLDEPLWFGHFYSGPNACRSSLDNLVHRTATLVTIFTAAFPDAVVGDTEPFPALSRQPDWAATYAAWLEAFHQATGTRIAFLHLDFNWGDPSLNPPGTHDGSDAAAVTALAHTAVDVARRNGLGVGMIYWGGGHGDAQWMEAARLHVREIEASHVKVDHRVFTSWNPAPTHTFPANDPNALASLIPYASQHEH